MNSDRKVIYQIKGPNPVLLTLSQTAISKYQNFKFKVISFCFKLKYTLKT
jgi:hypothetical protein